MASTLFLLIIYLWKDLLEQHYWWFLKNFCQIFYMVEREDLDFLCNNPNFVQTKKRCKSRVDMTWAPNKPVNLIYFFFSFSFFPLSLLFTTAQKIATNIPALIIFLISYGKNIYDVITMTPLVFKINERMHAARPPISQCQTFHTENIKPPSYNDRHRWKIANNPILTIHTNIIQLSIMGRLILYIVLENVIPIIFKILKYM